MKKIIDGIVLELSLPDWIADFTKLDSIIPTHEERMRLAIRLSEMNVQYRTGGPFGAVVIERNTGRLVSAGVNRVVPCCCSAAHAEMVALTAAQYRLNTFDLGAKHGPVLDLYTSAQMCIQCFGAVWWSGIKGVYTGARGSDVEALTDFDEGPIPQNWADLLRNRKGLPPVDVTVDLLRDEAMGALRSFGKGAQAYNAGST